MREGRSQDGEMSVREGTDGGGKGRNDRKGQLGREGRDESSWGRPTGNWGRSQNDGERGCRPAKPMTMGGGLEWVIPYGHNTINSLPDIPTKSLTHLFIVSNEVLGTS